MHKSQSEARESTMTQKTRGTKRKSLLEGKDDAARTKPIWYCIHHNHDLLYQPITHCKQTRIRLQLKTQSLPQKNRTINVGSTLRVYVSARAAPHPPDLNDCSVIESPNSTIRGLILSLSLSLSLSVSVCVYLAKHRVQFGGPRVY